jgi:hypothetical protein
MPITVKELITLSLCNNVPNGITNTHSQKLEEILQKRSYSDLFLVAAVQIPPRQHQKFSFSNSDVFKKETVTQAP